MICNRNVVLVLLLLLVTVHSLSAQSRRKRRPNSAAGTETTQWWIGFKAGTNFSKAAAEESYEFFSFTQEPQNYKGKQYEGFSTPGTQFGFIVSYEFMQGLSVNIMPSYVTYNYVYSNEYGWYSDTVADKSIEQKYTITNELQYVDIPLTFKYELTRTKLKPYVQIGGFYGVLTNAIKTADITSVDQASGGVQNQQVEVSSVSNDAKDDYLSNNYGLLAGGGFTYNVGNARVGLEVNYRLGMNTITNTNNRYNDDYLLTGLYDVMDDVKMDNLEISVNLYIPLKFITSKDYRPL